MPTFEFIVEGPPVALRAQNKNPKRYQGWIKKVREAAKVQWLPDKLPIGVPVDVVITNYYTLDPPDVDNVIKPILDALKTVVYTDDRQVYQVTSLKASLSEQVRMARSNEYLTEALVKHDEVLHIVVLWKEEG